MVSERPLVDVRDLTKMFRFQEAVKSINFTINRGDIFGLIGPNGAGKTTTIRMLATLLAPTSGNAFVSGLSIWRDKLKLRPRIGYMPDIAGFYQELTVEEYLSFFAAAYRIPSTKRDAIIKGILELIDLHGRRKSLIRFLSRGMRQRLELGRALVHDPDFLLLDEPASGLDPMSRVELREIIKELHRLGKTILISSHILPELEQVCNKVAIMDRGMFLFSGSIHELREMTQSGKKIMLRAHQDAEWVRSVLFTIAGVSDPVRAGEEVAFTYQSPGGDLNPLLKGLIEKGVSIAGLREQDVSLEEMYMKITRREPTEVV